MVHSSFTVGVHTDTYQIQTKINILAVSTSFNGIAICACDDRALYSFHSHPILRQATRNSLALLRTISIKRLTTMKSSRLRIFLENNTTLRMLKMLVQPEHSFLQAQDIDQ